MPEASVVVPLVGWMLVECVEEAVSVSMPLAAAAAV
jgi:hypothetical protein